MSDTAPRALIFLLGLAVGAGLAAWYYAPTQPAAPAESATSTAPADDASGDVSVADQPAGDSVEVAWVNVPPPGVWVAVEEVNEDGSLGNVLGAQFVGGPRSTVSVSLLRDTLPNETYAVVLYRDDGDGQFELGADSAYVDFDTGEPVEALFHTE